jgi:predicted dithiol-disulfide oxidoreductase (DUF899 family)
MIASPRIGSSNLHEENAMKSAKRKAKTKAKPKPKRTQKQKVSVETSAGAKDYPVAPRDQWLKARVALLKKEKQYTRLGDQLNRQRRALPWVKVEQSYTFDAPGGPQTLQQLFGNRSQLIVYHFMFAPEWDAGCAHCSFWADHYDASLVHLDQRDTAFACISRAPLEKIDAFKRRMGWRFNWVSSMGNSFNYDFNASFKPEENKRGTAFFNFKKGNAGATDREGASVFYKDPSTGGVYHTYSTFARGIDILNGTYHWRRDEDGLDFSQSWVRYHDQYGS